MLRKLSIGAMTLVLAGAAHAATFGKVVAIGGESVDLALDEPRGVLYVADFTGNRIDVISTATGAIKTVINVPNQPSSISVSWDDRWLIISHFGNNTAPATQTNMISLIDLTNNYARQTFQIADPPLGVAFGYDNNALIVTANSFQLLNPTTGSITLLQTVAQVASNAIPQPPGTFPLQFTQASIATSHDGQTIAGFGGQGNPFLMFRYSVPNKTISSGFSSASPAAGPRVISLSDDGSEMSVAWWISDAYFNNLGEFLTPSGGINVGTHVIDSSRNLIYAQMPSSVTGGQTTSATPVLEIHDADNLTLREQIQLPENLTGRSILSSDHNTMYSISASGVTILPVGSLNKYPRLTASTEDVVFRGNFCNRNSLVQSFVISDPGGNRTRFAITPNVAGIQVSPGSGTTPAVVTVVVDPNSFAGQTGSVLNNLTISSPDNTVIDLAQNVRVVVNSAQPAQRGVSIDVPGNVVDLMADPKRPAYYVARQDKNQVLVFNSANNTQTATLRTCTKPTSMTVTMDQQYLLVGCDKSQIIPVFDLDLLQEVGYISMGSDYVESLAVATNNIFAFTRSGADSTYGIDLVNLFTLSGSRPAQLGVWQNSKLASQGILSANSNGSHVIFAGADGAVMIFDATAAGGGTWVASRQDFSSLSGSAAASNYNQYAVGNNLLDFSGAPMGQMQTTGGFAAGFAFVNQTAYFTTSAPVPTFGQTGANGPGTISQVDVTTGNLLQPTPLVESPLTSVTAGLGSFPFPTCTTSTAAGGAQTTQSCSSTVGGVTTTTTTICNGVGSGSTTCQTQTVSGPAFTSASGFGRTIAPLNDQSAIVMLTTSGITVVPWTFAASVALPVISSVVSAADGRSAPAPGGLIEILGTQMSPTNLASSDLPLPTALANSCVVVNGKPVPLVFVSSGQINAQMPSNAFGDVTVQVLTPGGTSDNFLLSVPPTSPAVFLTATAGPLTNLPTVVRDDNNLVVTDSNPVHRGDNLTIYLTGCGQTTPSVPDGQAAPMSPLSIAVNGPVVTLGGVNLPTMFGGLTPGSVGLCQINVSVPSSVPQGLTVPLTITQGAGTQTLNLRVVE